MQIKKPRKDAGLNTTVIACLPWQAPEPDDDIRRDEMSPAHPALNQRRFMFQNTQQDGSPGPGLVLSPVTYSW